MSRKKVRRKHVPQRTCVGCREVLSKRSLIRIVRTPEGIRVDPTRKMTGRGAYLHDRKLCWEFALRGALSSALKVELTEEDKADLSAFMSNLPDEEQGV